MSSTLAKAQTHQFTQLENKIQSLQNLQKQCFTEQQATQLSSLKEEYDLLSHSKAEFILHRTRQKYYFESERPSHLLARRLKECESKAYIRSIKSSDDQVTTRGWHFFGNPAGHGNPTGIPRDGKQNRYESRDWDGTGKKCQREWAGPGIVMIYPTLYTNIPFI